MFASIWISFLLIKLITSESSCVACQEEICTEFIFDSEFHEIQLCWCRESRYKNNCLDNVRENIILLVGKYGIKIDFPNVKSSNSSTWTKRSHFVIFQESGNPEDTFQILKDETWIQKLKPETEYTLCITSVFPGNKSLTYLDCLDIKTRKDYASAHMLAAIVIGTLMTSFLVVLFIVNFVLRVWYQREMKFYNIKQEEDENTEAVLFRALESKLGILDARQKIIFQKVKRAQKYNKKHTYGPIIARFTSPGQSRVVLTAARKARADVISSTSGNKVVFKHPN